VCRESFLVNHWQILKNRLNFNLGIITTHRLQVVLPPLTSAFSMSDDNPSPEDNANRVNPLKLANRKKPCVYHPVIQVNGLINDFRSAVREIPSFTMDDILVERYTLCAVSMPCLRALLRVWGKMRTLQKSCLLSSSCNSFIPFLLRLTCLSQTQDPEGAPGLSKALAVGTSSL